MSGRARIALVSREVAPLAEGGIGTYVVAAARALASVAEVTIFTTDRHRRRHEQLVAAGDSTLAGLRLRFVPEPRGWEVEDYHGSPLWLWSARAYEALVGEYPDGGPDLVEFPDFLGEGFVAAQAARSLDPRLHRTTVCVRLYSTAEMTDVLNGHLPAELEPRLTYEIERYALANCDHVLWPGGDVLGTYERRLGSDAVAAPVLARHPLEPALEPALETRAPGTRDGLRLLCAGRLERRKGVLDLARAVSGIDADGLRVTIVGGDTDTAPLGQSMRAVLELMLAGDRRVEIRAPVSRGELAGLIEAHDAVVLPSLWECWPAVALEALERNRPLLATPTGGLSEIVDERSGWLTEGVGADPLAGAIEELLAKPDRARELSGTGGPRAAYATLTDPEPIRTAYLELAAETPRSSATARRTAPARAAGDEAHVSRDYRGQRAPRAEGAAGGEPLVSVVISYFRLERFVEATVRSAVEQTHRPVEVIVVNDGSFEAADRVLLELADRYPIELLSQPNSGLGAARNAGVAQSRGRYVFFCDADNVAAATFVERCVAVLEARPELAYATSWARYVDESGEQWASPGRGLRPLGNWSRLVEERNVAGDAAAVFRRSVFERGLRFSQELTSFEDWAFYRRMRRAGLVGHVIPEVLLDYRIRDDSMMRRLGAPNAERIEGEVRAHLAEAETTWTASG
ncbi:MAG: glycosyltransferase [Solirubrobacterales bacterium]